MSQPLFDRDSAARFVRHIEQGDHEDGRHAMSASERAAIATFDERGDPPQGGDEDVEWDEGATTLVNFGDGPRAGPFERQLVAIAELEAKRDRLRRELHDCEVRLQRKYGARNYLRDRARAAWAAAEAEKQQNPLGRVTIANVFGAEQ